MNYYNFKEGIVLKRALLLFLILAFALSMLGQVPRKTNYQGKLTNASGVAIDEPRQITFKIYNVATGGTALWSETIPSVPITKGLFDVVLGNRTPIPTTVDFSGQYWIELTVAFVGGGSEEILTPRQPFSSVPYAFSSHKADTAEYAEYAAVAGSLIGGSGIGGVGTDNYIPKWDGTGALTNSLLYQTDSSSAAIRNFVGVGTTTPAHRLHVIGGAESGTGPGGIPIFNMAIFGKAGTSNAEGWVGAQNYGLYGKFDASYGYMGASGIGMEGYGTSYGGVFTGDIYSAMLNGDVIVSDGYRIYIDTLAAEGSTDKIGFKSHIGMNAKNIYMQGGNIIMAGAETVDGVDISTLNTDVTGINASLAAHLANDAIIKHDADQIRLEGTLVNIPAGNVQSGLTALDANIGNRTYTERNYVTNSQSITASIDTLDKQAKNNADAITTLSTTLTLQGAYENGPTATINESAGRSVIINATGSSNIPLVTSATDARSIQAQNNSTAFAAVYAKNNGTGPAIMSDGNLALAPTAGTKIYSETDINVQLDNAGAPTSVNTFNILDDAGASVFNVNELGDVNTNRNVTLGGNVVLSPIGTVDGVDVSTLNTNYNAHVDGGASKHDASEIDIEGDGSYYRPENLEAVVDSLDNAITSIIGGTGVVTGIANGDITVPVNDGAGTWHVDVTTDAADFAETGASLAIANNAIQSDEIEDGQIMTADLGNLQVTNEKIAADAITNDKLADDAVQVENILNGAALQVLRTNVGGGAVEWATLSLADMTALTNANIWVGDGSNHPAERIMSGDATLSNIGVLDLTDGAVETSELAADAVTNAKLADNAVQTENILDLNVTNPKLANDVVTNAKIADDAVQTENILSGRDGQILQTIGTDVFWTSLSVSSITTLSNNNIWIGNASNRPVERVMSGDAVIGVTGVLDINDGAVETSELAGDAVTNAKLADDAVQVENILNGTSLQVLRTNASGSAVEWANLSLADMTTLTNANIWVGDGTNHPIERVMSGDAIINNTGVLDLNDGAVETSEIAGDAVTNAKLADNAVQTENIVNLNVTTPKLNDDAVTNAKLADNAVQTENIVDLNVTTAKLAADAVTNAKLADDAVQVENILNGASRQILQTNAAGTAVEWAALNISAISSLNNANVWIGDDSNTPIQRVFSGDAALSNTGVIDLTDGAVETAEIAADAVTNAKLADNAVQTENIVDLNVTTSKLAPDVVTNAKLADDAVQVENILNGTNLQVLRTNATGTAVEWANLSLADMTTLTSGNIWVGNATNSATERILSGDATISNTGVLDLSDGAVETSEIASDAVINSKIANEAVQTENIADLSVTTTKLAADAVTNTKLADDAVQVENILQGTAGYILQTNATGSAVEWARLDPSSMLDLTNSNIWIGNASNIPVAHVMSGDATLGNTGVIDLTDGAVETAEIAADAVVNSKIADNAVQTENIVDLNVTTEKLAADAVTNAKLADNAVQTENIVDLNVTTSKLAADAVTNAKLADDAVQVENILQGTAGYILQTNATGTDVEWARLDPASMLDLTNANIWIGNASNIPVAHVMSGDATLDNTGTLDLSDGAVETSEIAGDAVINSKIADNAVRTENIENATILTEDIADLQITNAKIANGAVDITKINLGTTDPAVDADNIPYNPNTPTDWAIAPTEVENAIDVLASQIYHIIYTGGAVSSISGGTGIVPDGPSTGPVGISIDLTELTVNDPLSTPTATTLNLDYNADNFGLTPAGALEIKDGGVISAEIANGTIVNEDVNDAAAIAESKLALDHSTQDLFDQIGALDGNVTAIVGSRDYTEENYITDDSEIGTALNNLDMALNDIYDTLNIARDSIAILDDAIGNRTYTEDNYITDGQTVTQSLDALDMSLKDLDELVGTVNGDIVAASGLEGGADDVLTGADVDVTIGIADNGIQDNHIDWGLTDPQIDADNIPYDNTTGAWATIGTAPVEVEGALSLLANKVDGIIHGEGSVNNIEGGIGLVPDGPTDGDVSLAIDLTELTVNAPLSTPDANTLVLNYNADDFDLAGGTLQIKDGGVNSTEVLNGTLVNEDIADGAAIAESKLDLDYATSDLYNSIGDRGYTENNYVIDNETVTASIDTLDKAVKNVTDALAIAAIGFTTELGNRNYTEDNYVTDAETFTASIDTLDKAVKNVTDALAAAALGFTTELGDRNYTENNYVTDAETFTASIDTLDMSVKNVTDEVARIESGTLITDMNADLLDGQHGDFYQNADNINAGTLPVDYGGTGLNAVANNDLLYGSGTSVLNTLPPTGTNTYLRWTGLGYEWADPTGGTGGAANQHLSNLGTTAINSDLIPNADNTLDLGAASDRWNDIYMGGQIINGASNYTLPPVSGTLALISDVTALSFWNRDASNNLYPAILDGKVGIGTSTPSQKLHVVGTALVDGELRVTGNTIYGNSTGTANVKVSSLGGGRFQINSASSSGTGTFAVMHGNATFGAGTKVFEVDKAGNGWFKGNISMDGQDIQGPNAMNIKGTSGIDIYLNSDYETPSGDFIIKTMTSTSTEANLFRVQDNGNTTIYGTTTMNDNATLTGDIDVSSDVVVGERLRLTPISDPTAPNRGGDLYVDSDDNNLYYYKTGEGYKLIGLDETNLWTTTYPGFIHQRDLTDFVGIGTDVPISPLHVIGDVTVETGTIHIGGPLADVSDAIGDPGVGPSMYLSSNGASGVEWKPIDFTDMNVTLTDGNIWIGDGSNLPVEHLVSGDATIANDGTLDLTDNAVENSEIADNAVNSAKIENETILSEDILDGTIYSTDIAADAAIEVTKLSNGGLTSKILTVDDAGTITWAEPSAATGWTTEANYITPTLGGGIKIYYSTVDPGAGPYAGDIRDVMKIDAQKVDPVVQINGQQYATWMAEAIGLNVDVVGQAQLVNGIYKVDLAKQGTASDLWLFYHVVAENSIIPFVTAQEKVVLCAHMEGSVLVVEAISGKMDGKFGYRLTGKRIDEARTPAEITNTRDASEKTNVYIDVDKYDKNGNKK